ncbi:putative helicase mov-10-B.1 [Orbicella faveolata]|uniref:putative helicase mov-10-B.1 n=1 Tax=Orbicella faveolata TaxID=48498 RepID=UPI0009E30FD2|nr:putative helicase mov-10-B.1 [Orbicella faveolata]
MYAASRPWDFVPQPLKDARVVNFDPVWHEIFYPSKEDLMSKYRIIVTTLVTAGRLVSAKFPRNHFSHIFIDEAGHATEPECIIPVADLLDPNHPRGGQLVLAGDPKQLGPILRSRTTREYGLETSLLERLMTSCNTYSRDPRGSYDSDLLTKLVNNYRSHKNIIEIPNELFYDNELKECAGDFRNVMLDWEQLPNKKFPMIFHAVYGKDEREEYSPSFFNIPEVDTIERYLKMLLDDNVRSRRLKHLKPEMIGIISPYKRQVSRSCGRISATATITKAVTTSSQD